MPEKLCNDPFVQYKIKLIDDNGELVEKEFKTDKVEGKHPSLNFNYAKNFTIESVNHNMVLYWLKENVSSLDLF